MLVMIWKAGFEDRIVRLSEFSARTQWFWKRWCLFRAPVLCLQLFTRRIWDVMREHVDTPAHLSWLSPHPSLRSWVTGCSYWWCGHPCVWGLCRGSSRLWAPGVRSRSEEWTLVGRSSCRFNIPCSKQETRVGFFKVIDYWEVQRMIFWLGVIEPFLQQE